MHPRGHFALAESAAQRLACNTIKKERDTTRTVKKGWDTDTTRLMAGPTGPGQADMAKGVGTVHPYHNFPLAPTPAAPFTSAGSAIDLTDDVEDTAASSRPHVDAAPRPRPALGGTYYHHHQQQQQQQPIQQIMTHDEKLRWQRQKEQVQQMCMAYAQRNGAPAAVVGQPAATLTPQQQLDIRQHLYMQQHQMNQARLAQQAYQQQQAANSAYRPVYKLPPTILGGQLQQQQQQHWGQQQVQIAPRPMVAQSSRSAAPTGSASAGGVGPLGQWKRPREEDPEVEFAVAGRNEFSVKISGKVPSGVISSIRLIPGARLKKKKRKWYLPLSAHQNLMVALDRVRRERGDEWFNVDPIPPDVLSKLTVRGKGKQSAQQQEAHEQLKGRIPENVLAALAPFQKEGVAFVLRHNGRALIADEMGLGKTLQAIGVASAYTDEWPLLVICPSSARFHWEAELQKWLGDEIMDEEDIVVITAGSQTPEPWHKAIIVSYDLVKRMSDTLTNMCFKVVIADECHYLKNHTARRTKVVLPLLRTARRAILLSGTPALSRPRELFTQLNVLDPEAWPDVKTFVERYCTGGGGTRRKWGKGHGANNLRELNELLKATVMVRRIKKDILTNLPPKKRHLHFVDLPDEEERAGIAEGMHQLKLAHNKLGGVKGKGVLGSLVSSSSVGKRVLPQSMQGAAGKEEKEELQKKRKALLMELFAQTGAAKLKVVTDRIREVLSDRLGGKLLVFAHHRNVLDSVEKAALSNVPHIRIDGSTHPKERQTRVQKFQTDPSIRVALLSLTAAGVAITLTAASRALFAELFWTPAALLQAEDRCHRIGQTSEVHIEYLIARGSLDDCLWPLIRKKMKVLGEMVGGDDKMELTGEEEARHGGDFDDNGKSLGLPPGDTTLLELAREDRDKGEGDDDDDDADVENSWDPSEDEDSSSSGSEAAAYDYVDLESSDDEKAERKPQKLLAQGQQRQSQQSSSTAVVELDDSDEGEGGSNEESTYDLRDPIGHGKAAGGPAQPKGSDLVVLD